MPLKERSRIVFGTVCLNLCWETKAVLHKSSANTYRPASKYFESPTVRLKRVKISLRSTTRSPAKRMLVFFEEDKTTAILNTSKVKQIIGGNKLEDGAIVVVEYDNADYEALVIKLHGKKKGDITYSYSYSIKLIYKNLRLDTAFYIYELFLLHFY